MRFLGPICLMLLLACACGQEDPEVSPAAEEWEPARHTPVESVPVDDPATADPIVEDLPQPTVAPEEPPQHQIASYEAREAKTVVELQQFRQNSSVEIRDQSGKPGTATLVNLNPNINSWFLLYLKWATTNEEKVYHLENPGPTSQKVTLDPAVPEGLVLEVSGKKTVCALWSDSSSSPLTEARKFRQPFVPLCEGRLFLRNPTEGHKTTLEWATDFLRDNVAAGEQITVFVRDSFYKDAYLEEAQIESGDPSAVRRRSRPPGAPTPASIDPRYESSLISPENLGIELEDANGGKVLVGRWYQARNLQGVYLSTLTPGVISEELIAAHQGLLNPLDEVESKAIAYLIAFDLDEFQLDFSVGTEHPRVDWSERVLPEALDPSLPGPDGIGTVAPLIRTGMTRPDLKPRVTASFTGGFKRYHGAFRRGEFALHNSGTHYGFLEHGVLMSKLHPGLATIVVLKDGRVELKTWTEEDNKDLAQIRHARQNGVPIVEIDQATGTPRPGALTARPAMGNWSGSVEGRYRTLRSGIGVQERNGDRFLVYAYYSSATPSGMARVFLAYGCRYAMLLDMNALEHTYLAVYRREDSQLKVQHLIRGMEVLDRTSGGQTVPRFLGYADNRDFFTLQRKGSGS